MLIMLILIYMSGILADRSNLRSEPFRDNDHVLNCFLQCKKEVRSAPSSVAFTFSCWQSLYREG